MNKIKIKFKEIKLTELLQNELVLKLIAVVVAIFIFMTVTGFGAPFWNDIFTTTSYIEEVPLVVNYDEDAYVVSGFPATISVNVSGSENDVSAVMKQKDNLVATVNLQYGAGSYSYDTSLIEFNKTLPVQITPVVSSFPIEVQDKINQTQTIDLNYINGSDSDTGFLLSNPVLSQESVVATGGSNDVESIVSVRGFVDLSTIDTSTSSGTQKYTVNLVPYNQSGEVVPNIELTPSTVEVTQDYNVSSVEVPVNYSVVNNNTGLYISSICEEELQGACGSDYTPTVMVYGDKDKISDLQYVTYQINLADFTGTSGVVEGTPILESGVYIVGDANKTYDIELKKGKTETIENVPITVFGLNQSFVAKAVSSADTSVDVTVTGAESVIDSLTVEDINLAVDLSDVTTPGVYSVPIKLSTDKYFDYELSKNEIQIQVDEVENE